MGFRWAGSEKSSNPTQSRGEEILGGCCVFFHFFQLRGNKNILQEQKVDDNICDFILSNTIFEFFFV